MGRARGLAWSSFPRWVLVLVFGLAVFEATRRAVLATDNPRLVPAMVLFGTLVVPVTFATFVWDRHVSHGVSAVTAAVVAAAGGAGAVAAAAVAENAAMIGGTIGAAGQLPLLAVGVVEEATKLVVVVVALRWAVMATAVNGLLVGVACGAGFAVLETLGYEFVTYVQQADSAATLAAVDAELVTRSLFAPATHLAWAGVMGCAVGHAASRASRFGPVLLAVLTFGLVAVLHTVWDQNSRFVVYLPLTAFNLLLLAAAMSLAGRSDRYGSDPPLLE